ncbi:MAG: homocysteine S-methyltransferase family protein [Gammaproteobacteria bacterium]
MAFWRTKLEEGHLVLLDGGTGSELQRRGVPMSGAAWSGTAAYSHPQTVQEVHEDYIRACAEIIITNTFGTARFMLDAAGLGEEFETINRKAVEAAIRARDKAAVHPVAIAGSMSTLPPNFDVGAYPEPERECADYWDLAALLADAGVDLIALEMMQDLRHASRAMDGALSAGLPVMLGVSGRRHPTSDEIVCFDLPELALTRPLEALVEKGPAVVNVMHSALDAVADALALVRERFDGFVGVYPETGDFQAPDWDFQRSIAPETLVAHARAWVKAGARLIGGCCGTSPDHIRALKAALPELEASMS